MFGNNFGVQGKYLIDFYHVALLGRGGTQNRGTQESFGVVEKTKRAIVPGASQQDPPHPGAAPGIRGGLGETGAQRLSLSAAATRSSALRRGAAGRTAHWCSGEVESAHRHVIQQRLKIAGGWWREKNAQQMLGLRVARANHCWGLYWARN
jgi:hypothetical protein